MDHQLDAVALGFGDNTAYAGVALYDFAGYADLADVTIPHQRDAVILPDLKVKYPFEYDPKPLKPWWQVALPKSHES